MLVEFELEGGEMTVSGNVSITLPPYITLLPQVELDWARHAPFADRLIIAAGRQPSTGDIVALSGAGKLYNLACKRHRVPDGPVCPTDYGKHVAIGTGFLIVASWLIVWADRVYNVEVA